jgi:hypothetical protein
MWHYDPAKYDNFPGMDNIIEGNGELVAVKTELGKGWITLNNEVIYNRKDAQAYARRLDDLITFNRQRVTQKKVKY